MKAWKIAHVYLRLVLVGMFCPQHSPAEGRKERQTSDFKYSDRGRMFRPIQFTVLELNYNFQLLTIQI